MMSPGALDRAEEEAYFGRCFIAQHPSPKA